MAENDSDRRKRAIETTEAARAIVASETERREQKTVRLKALRSKKQTDGALSGDTHKLPPRS